jgi:hypothetical protein
MAVSGEKRYEALSPFESKNRLIELAGGNHDEPGSASRRADGGRHIDGGPERAEGPGEESGACAGYTLPYAIGNVLLTVWGTAIVYAMHRSG